MKRVESVNIKKASYLEAFLLNRAIKSFNDILSAISCFMLLERLKKDPENGNFTFYQRSNEMPFELP